MAEHTPWTVEDRRRSPLPNIVLRDARGEIVAEVEGVHMRDGYVSGWTHEQADAQDAIALARAAFIVRAVNSHEKLLEALTVAMSWLDSPYFEPPKSCGQCGNGSCDGDCVMAAALSSDYKTMQDAVRAAQGA